MNLAEKMALDCGVKISKPHVDRLFMPIRNNKFIIFDTRAKHAIGSYDYFADVFDFLKILKCLTYLQQRIFDFLL